MPGILGQPRHYHSKFRFLVEIDGLGSAAFQSCSELTAEVAETTYYEGGSMIPIKEPARMSVADITIERAATQDKDLYTWFTQTANATLNGGVRSPKFKRTASIVQFDRDNRQLRRWLLVGLWPKKFTAGAWDNNSDDFTLEQVVLAFDFFQLRRNVG
jgi:phage tail-like protein